MGSSAFSQTVHSNNAPTVQDNTNPLLLTGSANARIGSDNISVSSGATINTLDGGAIAGAFEVTENSVASVLDLTAKLIEQNSANTTAFQAQVKSASQEALGYVSTYANKEGEERTLLQKILIGGGVLAGLFLMLKYSKLGR